MLHFRICIQHIDRKVIWLIEKGISIFEGDGGGWGKKTRLNDNDYHQMNMTKSLTFEKSIPE